MRYFFHLSIVFALLFSACEDKAETKYIIEFIPASEYDFGKVEINQSVSKKIRVKNSEQSSGFFTGTVEIVDSPAFRTDFRGVLTLQKNESVEMYLTFRPTAAEDYSSKLVIQNDQSLNEFYLSGIGASPVSFSISPTSLDFGLVTGGESKELDLVFNNNASSGFDLELSLDLPVGDFTIGGLTNFTLSPNVSKTITVLYTPTLNTSSKTLQVNHNSSAQPSPAKIQITGIKDISSELITSNSEAWDLFKNKNYAESRQKFQDAINKSAVNAVYDSISEESTHGRGWARLFAQDGNDYAQAAYNDFLNCYTTGLLSSNSDNDALAGISISGVLIVSQAAGHYTNIVTAATTLLDNVSNYKFSYNSKVDYKDVRYALIQAYFNLSYFAEAAKELDILVPVNAPHSSSPEELLAAIQALAGQL
ncbi:MAG: hypothetical protein CMG44_03720 [Candidatus Marinimicrobia bacterium]|nr:hypothetical protein [Candidatus Neomarinimicrobiota bacterium]|tara:strand:+ start:20189 stop:21451 length:1263 start_codon:yes stop_codon:yes gene_type:complete